MAGRAQPHPMADKDVNTYDLDSDEQPPPKRVRGAFTCNLCIETFTEKRSLVRHMRAVHTGSTRVQCGYCSDSFAREDVRKRHERRKHPEVGQENTNRGREVGDLINSSVLPDPGVVHPTNSLKFLEFMDTQGHFDDTTCSLQAYDREVVNNIHSDIFKSSFHPASEPAPVSEFYGPTEVWDIPFQGESKYTTSDDVLQSSVDSISSLSMSRTSLPDETVFVADPPGIQSTCSSSSSSLHSEEDHIVSPEIERMSMDDTTSIVSTASHQTSSPRSELPLSLLKSRLSLLCTGATPRSRAKKAEVLCVLCRSPFGLSHTEIRDHLHRHAESFTGSYACLVCQIAFTHESDLLMHERSAAKGHCGFHFDHSEPCQGHHIPTQMESGLSDHDRFTLWSRVRHWEQAQLKMYLSQVSDLLSNDYLPPDVDSWSINGALRCSVTSFSSRFSSFTIRSAPNPLDHSENVELARTRGMRKYFSRLTELQEQLDISEITVAKYQVLIDWWKQSLLATSKNVDVYLQKGRKLTVGCWFTLATRYTSLQNSATEALWSFRSRSTQA